MSDTIDALARHLNSTGMYPEAASDIQEGLTSEGLSIVKTADWERAYTLLVSATPALWRRFEDSPNDVAAHLNGVLSDAVVDWVQDYQRSTGRPVDEFPRALETP